MKASEYFLLPGILLALTIGLGIWLGRLGKPYDEWLFTAHKLLALAAVVIAVLKLLRFMKTVPIPFAAMALLILAALAVVILFASGAFMSLNMLNQKMLLLMHRVTTAIITAAGTLVVVLLKETGPLI